MITASDLHALAVYMRDRHGPHALTLADLAVGEMEAQGETERADAWRALRAVIGDLVDGRIAEEAAPTLH